MTTPTFSISLVRELRGSPLTVLVAIMLLEQSGQVPATAQLLKDVTGYKDHTITDSLRVLESPTRQIVSRVRGGWRIMNGYQLPLEIQNREYRDNRLSDDDDDEIERGTNRRENIIINTPQNREYRESLHAAIEAGIMEPKASQVARLDWATPEYIQALAQVIQKENRFDNPAGMLVHQIVNHYPAPKPETTESRVERFLHGTPRR